MVAIVDDEGTLLARGTEEGLLSQTSTRAQEMRINYESRMVRTIEELLGRSLGPGNVRAQVAAEMDFDRITENAEIYDPDGQVVRSRSEEHTSELQSLMRISYAVFCLKHKKITTNSNTLTALLTYTII